jgi:hypothetical protein
MITNPPYDDIVSTTPHRGENEAHPGKGRHGGHGRCWCKSGSCCVVDRDIPVPRGDCCPRFRGGGIYSITRYPARSPDGDAGWSRDPREGCDTPGTSPPRKAGASRRPRSTVRRDSPRQSTRRPDWPGWGVGTPKTPWGLTGRGDAVDLPEVGERAHQRRVHIPEHIALRQITAAGEPQQGHSQQHQDNSPPLAHLPWSAAHAALFMSPLLDGSSATAPHWDGRRRRCR